MLDNLATSTGLLILLGLSALFSATETAFTSLSIIKAEKLSKEPFTGWYVTKVSSNKRKLIITVLIGNNIVNILISVVSAAMFVKFFGDSGIAIVTGILTFILLLFGEIIPKTYAQMHNDKIVRVMAIPIFYLQLAMIPFVWFFETITTILFFSQRNRIRELFGDSELATALDIGVSQKAFTAEEKETILKFLRMDDTPAKKIMTPLAAVFSLESDMSVKEALPLIKNERFSRIPLYDDTKTNITGFIHIKDLSDISKIDEERALYLYSRGVIKVADVRAVSDVFKEMLQFHTHIAIVMKGEKAVGIITLEDALEEFVGEIYDETDSVNADNFPISAVIHASKPQYVVEGNLPMSQVEVMLKQALPKRKDTDTLSDMLLSFIKDPSVRKSVVIEGITFKILGLDNGIITKVKIVKRS